MHARKLLLSTVCLSIAAVAAINLSADDKSSLVALQKKDKKKAKRKYRGRLPFYYKKAGVTEAQTKKIYAIQLSYYDKIKQLEKQLSDLKDKRNAEVEAVLTATQKKKVEELREEARKKREAKKKEREAKKKSKKANTNA